MTPLQKKQAFWASWWANKKARWLVEMCPTCEQHDPPAYCRHSDTIRAGLCRQYQPTDEESEIVSAGQCEPVQTDTRQGRLW